MTTAMIRCLRQRFPIAQIDMIVRDDFVSLIQDSPHLDRKLSLKRKEGLRGLLNLKKEINKQHYDLIYDAHRSLRTRILMPFLMSSDKRYLKKHYLRRSLSLFFKWKALIRNSPRMLERFIEPLKSLGVLYDGKGPEIFLPDTPSFLKLAEKHNLDPNLKYIGIIPSAQWPGKRWPTDYFRSTIESLLRTTAESFIIFGGPTDHFCKDITRGLDTSRVINLQGKLSLTEVFQLFSLLKCCLSNDTGLMHVADARGIPNIVIFGPTNSDLGCKPFHPLSQILEKKIWCRPCSKNGQAPCIRSQRWCLSLIHPEEAIAAFHRLLPSLSKANES